MLLSEANQWPEDVRPYFGKGDEFHMNFHFPLMPRIFMALAGADRHPDRTDSGAHASLYHQVANGPPSCVATTS